MPRPRTISWATRVAIFLDYRRVKKVHPTAKKHGVARSTVVAILEEFTKQDFSKEPRLDPARSLMILVQAQEHHLQEILQGRHTRPTIRLVEPSKNVRAGLDPEDAIGEDATLKLAQQEHIPLEESLLWHLKGAEAELMVQESRQALQDYDQHCLDLWRDVSSVLGQECGLSVEAYHPRPVWPDQEPHLAHELVDLIYSDLWNPVLSVSHPPESWRTADGDPAILKAGTFAAVAGGPEQHEATRKGVGRFLKHKFGEYQRRATNLSRLHHDLEYVTVIVQDALQGTTEEQVRQGICPACPYPEARLNLT